MKIYVGAFAALLITGSRAARPYQIGPAVILSH